MRFRSLAVCALVSSALTACGQLPAGPDALARGTGALDALADFPSIDAQIVRATVARDQTGTRVSRMPDPGRAKPVTFLTYKALDNNLGHSQNSMRPFHINILERAGSNSGINVVALTDEDGPNNTYAYYVRQDADEQKVTSPYMPIWPGERDTGSAYTLAQAVRWGFTSYPAKLRWLDINDHGHGAFGVADDGRSGSTIPLPELTAALQVGSEDRKLDVVSFDACLMATAEVAHELRGAARYLVASEDLSLALGMNYDKTIKSLEGKTYDAATLARALVMRAERRGPQRALYSLSALDLAQAGRLTSAVDRLAGALLAAVPTQRDAIRQAIAATPRFHLATDDSAGATDEHHRDLAALVAALRGRVEGAEVRAAADGVSDVLFGRERLVMLSLNAPEEKEAAQGVSIHVRADGVVAPAYRRTAFARDTRWDEFLASLR